MPFSGVRISWLITARKSDLAALAASASPLASDSSAVRLATSASRLSICAAIWASRSRMLPSRSLKPSTKSRTSPSAAMSFWGSKRLVRRTSPI